MISPDEYFPTVLDLNPDLALAHRDALEAKWSESHRLDAYTYWTGDAFRVEFRTWVSDLSDRSAATLSAKLDTMIETVKNHLGGVDLPRLARDYP